MRFLSLTLTLALLASVANAKPPLRDVAEIDDALMKIAIANEIRNRCDGIEARMLRALSEIGSLRARARALGYTRAEIRAYTDSREEEARLRSKASNWLLGQGVTLASNEQLCAFGKKQMKTGSEIGKLLR